MNLKELTNAVRRRLTENGGKLFLVGDSKSACARAAGECIPSASSVLVVVQSAETARDFAELYRAKGDFTVIENYAQFTDMAASAGIDLSRAWEHAERFSEKYPAVIVCGTEQEGSVFAHALCEDPSPAGIFRERDAAGNAPFLFMDFLAACRYQTVIVDEVYALIGSERLAGEPDPALYERWDFLGEVTYADCAHSHRRLKRLAESTERCILLSSTVADSSIARLYAVLHLLHDSVNERELKKQVCAACPDFGRVCENIGGNLAYVREEEAVLSSCLSYREECVQMMPDSISSLRQYILARFKYMPEEEIGLRALDAMRQIKPNLSLEGLVEAFGNASDVEMARCLYGMFFRDTVKGELERGKNTAELQLSDAKALTDVIRVFLKYGVLQTNEGKDRLKLVRIRCESDGYEGSVRALEEGESGDIVYSVCCAQDEHTYKCLAIADLMKNNLLPSPVLLIAGEERQELKKRFATLFPGHVLSEDLHDLEEKGNRFVFADIRRLRETALPVSPASTLIYDFPTDPECVMRLLADLYSRAGAQVYMLTSHSDLSDRLADAWGSALRHHATVPFGFSEVTVKEGTDRNYADVLADLEGIYRTVDPAARDALRKNSRQVAGEFDRAVGDYTTDPPPVSDASALELVFFRRVAKSYGQIFSNSVSAGGAGERTVREERKYFRIKPKTRKEKKNPVYREQVDMNEEAPLVFFNVCSRMLLRHCDPDQHECFGCKDYERLMCNRFADFEAAVQTFFKEAEDFTESLRLIYDKRLSDLIIIGGAEADRSYGLPRSEAIREQGEKAAAALAAIKKKRTGSKMFVADYSDVLQIKQAAASVYSEYLKKYTGRLLGMFEDVTQKAVAQWTQIASAYDGAASEK